MPPRRSLAHGSGSGLAPQPAGYGLRRRRLKGHDGQQANTGWGGLTYTLDTLAIRTA